MLARDDEEARGAEVDAEDCGAVTEVEPGPKVGVWAAQLNAADADDGPGR